MTDESWGFEWGTADGDGGFVRLALHRAERIASYWAYLWRPGTGPVAVRDHEVTLPRGAALEIRAEALWSELVCETPGEHWSIGLEAFGVALDDPMDGLHGEIGERIALGFDFEWERAGDPAASEMGGVAYDEQPGVVHGEILLGRGRFPLDSIGFFEHSSGPVDRSVGGTRTTIAWDDASWSSQHHLGAPSDVEVTPRSVAVIPLGEAVVTRSLGTARAGGRHGTCWMESVAAERAKIR